MQQEHLTYLPSPDTVLDKLQHIAEQAFLTKEPKRSVLSKGAEYLKPFIDYLRRYLGQPITAIQSTRLNIRSSGKWE